MKYKKVFIALIFMQFLLISCAPSSDIDMNQSEVVKIKVTLFEDFGKESDAHYMSITERDDIQTFIDAINTSLRIEGDVDMPKGDYNLALIFDNGREEIYHLWIADEYSTGILMNITATTDAYEMTRKSKEQIRTILPH